MSTYLEFNSVSKRFGRMTALRQVTLAVHPGQVLALLGPNGAGKSTLFGCLLGLLQPSGGDILRHGKRLTSADRLRFGYLPERLALYPHRSVWDNGVFFTELKGCPPEELERQLKRVGLHQVAHRGVRQLSKGMLQRLGLAIALAGNPELLVLDEPFNGLDPALLESLQHLLREENQRGATLLVSTHTLSAIEPLATHAVILLSGQVVANAGLDELRRQHGENSLEAVYQQVARQHHALEPEEICA